MNPTRRIACRMAVQHTDRLTWTEILLREINRMLVASRMTPIPLAGAVAAAAWRPAVFSLSVIPAWIDFVFQDTIKISAFGWFVM